MKDIAIIGAGPTGIYAAFYAGLRGLNGYLLEATEEVGGQAMVLFRQKGVYDFPGVVETTGEGLIRDLLRQYAPFSDAVQLKTNCQIQKLKKIEGGFELETPEGPLQVKTICVSVGPGSSVPRKLDVPGEDKHLNVTYGVSDINVFYGKNVIIFGGGDSAVDWANMLEGKAKVTLVHRRDHFRAKADAVATLRKHAKVITGAKASKINGAKITITNCENKAETVLEFDNIIVQFGLVTSYGEMKNWGVEWEKGKMKVNGWMKTTIPGIWAIGNAAHYEGKVTVITSGLGDVISAMSSIASYINPNASLVFYSSVKPK